MTLPTGTGALAAAISNAGGLGTVGSGVFLADAVSATAKEIRDAKKLTSKPFAVNFPGTGHEPYWGKAGGLYLADDVSRAGKESGREVYLKTIEIAIEQGVKIAITSAAPPVAIKGLKDAGMKVIHVVASVEQARQAEAEGADAIVASGFEAGGHTTRDEVTLLALLPLVVDAVKVPVLAAGAIVDARSFAAALTLGAEGAYMGTRFLATHEAPIAQGYKESIVRAKENDTIIVGRYGRGGRTAKNKVSLKAAEMERVGASWDEVKAFYGPRRDKPEFLDEGELIGGFGQGAGRIAEILSCGEVIRRMVEGVPAVLAAVQSRIL